MKKLDAEGAITGRALITAEFINMLRQEKLLTSIPTNKGRKAANVHE